MGEDEIVTKKNGVTSNSKAINGHSNGNVGIHTAAKEGRGVGKMISNIMTNASAACYIGQNGLYQSNGKSKETDFCKNNGQQTNGQSNGRANGQTNGYTNVQKKDL